MLLALILVGAVIAWLYYERRRELFLVSVRGGKALLVRGRLPASLMNDIKDVVGREPAVRFGRIRAVKDQNRARLVTTGIDEFRAQRLRNVFSVHPISNLVAAPPVSGRSVGQILGIAWLAWLLDRTLEQ
ncbi:MAG: DUF3634 family protein [Myxococcales bacterium]